MRSPVVVSTVSAPAATYDLTDKDTAKDELGITDTSNDAWISRGISQVSALIMSETSRVFAPECVQDVFDIPPNRSQRPGGVSELQLSRWPILGVVSVVQGLGSTTPVTLIAGTDFRIDAEHGLLLRLNSDTGTVSAWEPMPTTVKYTAGYGALVQESHTVPSTPFQVTVAKASAFSCDQSVAYASGVFLTLVSASPGVGQYAVAQGLYAFNVGDVGQVLSFAYCTLSVPNDLADIVLRLVTGRFSAKGRDPSLVQIDTPGVGTQRWWFGSVPGQTGPFPPDIAASLDKYRVPVVA